MVDLSDRLKLIRSMVDAGQYFTMNRARQYGKTTTLAALSRQMRDSYDVISLDFQGLDDSSFKDKKAGRGNEIHTRTKQDLQYR